MEPIVPLKDGYPPKDPVVTVIVSELAKGPGPLVTKS
jgi:hypothetical protein